MNTDKHTDVLRTDTNIGPAHGHKMPCNNSHYGHFVYISHYCMAHYGLNPVKGDDFRHTQEINDTDIRAISFLFLPYVWPKMTILEEALPMPPLNSYLCFWNEWNMKNGNI